ncbi:hypothetical protein DCS_06810 [Drechmeria coniospora]|uniref:Uncharacterized protein n=1 Tax=Drechmeria coniospora TaxID=98403 RepID=A0A151GCL9_DRECN|nr:hypothetical protein DCS_06810 [Drechmeria coniospora]KYK54849.1 hypothetical protein DCS_06810 [Drechmeria coniospora]ODA75921.1 hypothetical protein RJ55_08562 [Drechmeria coniospora]
MAGSSPASTPKRKRGEALPVTPVKFSFDMSQRERPGDRSDSPRSMVARRFRGLVLDGDGGGGGGSGVDADVDDTDVNHHDGIFSDVDARKRHRAAPAEPVISESTCMPASDVAIPSTEPAEGSPTPERWMPVVDHPADHGIPGRKRTGTPPLRLKKSPAKEHLPTEAELSVADPVRAALTWHEDEITIYDANDADDDGTGINGVGFKPTPAMAQARALKRRQQLAEYRRREENEARARRSQRRRQHSPSQSGAVTKKRSPTRRVRFMDDSQHKIAVTSI